MPVEGIQNVFALDPGPAARRKPGAGPAPSHVLDPAGEVPVGLQIRELNNGAGVDVAIEVSGSNRGLQGGRAWRDGGGGRVLPGRGRQRPPR